MLINVLTVIFISEDDYFVWTGNEIFVEMNAENTKKYEWLTDVTKTGNRGVGTSGNPTDNSKWRTKEKKL